MSQRFCNVIFEDIQHQHCTDSEVEILLNTFEYTVKTMACTSARKACYDLQDYANAKRYGISHFLA